MKLRRIADLKNVVAVIEYGSYARGDNDKNSDYDLFILIKGKVPDFLEEDWKGYIESETGTNKFDISVYDIDTFELMLKHGSLFLWHLKLEGNIIYTSNSKKDLFSELQEFKGADEDLYLYRRLYKSTISSIEAVGANYYNLYILSLITRNVLIITCYKMKKIGFGKKNVYENVNELLNGNISISSDTYKILNDFRLLYIRAVNVDLNIENIDCSKIIEEIDNLIIKSFEIAKLRNNLDRVTSIIKNKVDRNLYASFEIVTEFERDLFVGMYELCKRELNYTLKGLCEAHRIRFEANFTKGINNEFVKLVREGFDIFEGLDYIKKSTSTYGSQSSNIFEHNQLLEEYSLDELILNFLSNNMIINQLRVRESKVYTHFIKLIEDRVADNISKGPSIKRFVEKVELFSIKINKYL